eukprot:354943_1
MKCQVKHRRVSSSNHQHLNHEELLALKLFTDQDPLQKEFSKSFWKVSAHVNRTLIVRRQQFYHWAHVLRRAFKYGHTPINRQLYRGLKEVLRVPSFTPFCGQPTSTTTNWNTAHSFSQGIGIIIHSDPTQIVYGMDLSLISFYGNESEIWLYDQALPLQKVAIMLNDEQTKIDYIATHLIDVPHPLKGIAQFLGPNEPNPMLYVRKMMQDTDVSRETQHQ